MPPCQCDDTKCAERHALYKKYPCKARRGPSSIPNAGDGLFAERAYKVGEIITFYSGTVVRSSTLQGDRVLSLDSCWNIDGEGVCRHACARGDLINHSIENQNCHYFTHNRSLRTVVVKTICAVSKNTEFFANYGPDFQFHRTR